MRKLSTVLIMLLCLSYATHLAAENAPANANILLAKYYINWAWGFDFKGITIDAAGEVYSFTYEEAKGRMPEFDRTAMTAEQINTLYQPGRKLIATIPADQLQQMIELIPYAAVGSMSEKVSEGADRGAKAWVAYCHDAQTATFKEIELKTQGDWSSHNLATAAAELLNQLNSIPEGK